MCDPVLQPQTMLYMSKKSAGLADSYDDLVINPGILRGDPTKVAELVYK